VGTEFGMMAINTGVSNVDVTDGNGLSVQDGSEWEVSGGESLHLPFVEVDVHVFFGDGVSDVNFLVGFNDGDAVSEVRVGAEHG